MILAFREQSLISFYIFVCLCCFYIYKSDKLFHILLPIFSFCFSLLHLFFILLHSIKSIINCVTSYHKFRTLESEKHITKLRRDDYWCSLWKERFFIFSWDFYIVCFYSQELKLVDALWSYVLWSSLNPEVMIAW